MLPSPAAARIASLLADQDDRYRQPRARPATILLVVLAAFLAIAFHAAPPAGSLATPTVRASGSDEVPTEDPRMRFHSKLGAMAGAVALSVGGQAVAQDAVQWREKDGGNGHWYAKVPREGRDWVDCAPIAVNVGGHLATLTSATETAFVVATILNGESAVIGGVQNTASPQFSEPAGGWEWITEEPWSYTNWHPCCGDRPEPNDWSIYGPENWLTVYGDGTWNDGPFNVWWTTTVLIEWSADCNADGIVDYGQILAGDLPDANGNNIPDCCEQGVSCSPCAADIARDGVVNGIDLAAVLTNWSTAGGPLNADVNQDGVVDGSDLAIVLASWGPCP